jgi:osmoprotectant transport system ATP-binding protein
MDEPFSAVDPIARLRLQDEFLRLQRTVRKTIVFVTHDIDEAVRLSDRVAVLSEGGVLEQYGTPADILREPRNEFVAQFVGADRGIKELSVTEIDVTKLRSAATVDVESGPSVPRTATLREALATLLVGGVGWVAVRDDDGSALGVLTASDIAGVVSRAASSSSR